MLSSQALRLVRFQPVAPLLLAFLLWSGPSTAQRSYPGWSAPKEVLPSEYNNATYPDIAAEGDTLHVIFRATFTVSGEGVGPSEEEELINRIVDVNQLLRGLRYTTAVESAGGKEKLRDLKKQLEDRLRKVQEEQERATATGTGPPVQTALYYTRSEDRGRTWWEKPVQVVYNPEAFLGQTSLTVDRQGLHVVYSAASGQNVLQVFSVHSTDGGNTWSKPLQVSESPFRKFSPQVAVAPGNGLLACWWELEETEIAAKTRPDLDALNDLLLNPLLTTTRQARTRVTIHYARYIGGSWMADQVLDTAGAQLPYLNLRTGLKGENYIYWLGDSGIECRVSRNGGVAWETTIEFAQVFNRENYNTFCPGGGELQFIRALADRRRSGQLFHRKGLFGTDWRNIIDNQTQYSYPEVDYTRDETQVIWGVTDPSGNHLLFFREDNKPPTSELTYPPDGDFAKYEITFIWSATDDIATRLDYRYVLMNRKDPNVRPEPHNFPLYAADNHYAIKANPDGYYTLYVQARDFSGNEEPKPTTFDYHTFYVPPKIEVNQDTQPPIKIQTRNIEVRWNVEDNTPGQSPPLIAYRLDGEPVTEFAPRTSVRISGLRDGWHQVQLYAEDSKGNVSTFGDTVSVEVDLQLTLNWRQIPVQPREGPRIYVREDSAPLSWLVSENTEDKNVGYFSSYEVVHDGKSREYSAPQANLETVLVGAQGGQIEEGEYIVTVLAQDEFGTPASNFIQTAFTVDHTPPEIRFNDPSYDPETKIPTVSVTATDNYSSPDKLEYQFRIVDATEGGWTSWTKEESFVCAGKPIKFYTWGYTVEVVSKDVAGNINNAPVTFSLIWYHRSPWMLYSLIGLAGLLALGVLFVIVSSLFERAKARKRAAARKAAALKAASEGPQTAAPVAAKDDLFAAPPTTATPTKPSSADLFGPATVPASPGFGMEPQKASPFDDPFASPVTTKTQVFDDPFAAPAPPKPPEPAPAPAISLDEDEPLEIGVGLGGEASISFAEEEPIEETPPAPPPKRDWSADQKVELSDRDLFDPL